jgi:TctA family transporter
MLEPFFAGFLLVFQWPAPLYLVLGVLFGIWLGAVPGLGGIIGLVILLPFTFGMETVPAIALLLGLLVVTATSDTIASVMLGIPGTAASQATILDGYPLAQQGQATRALGAAFVVSAFGGVFGAVVLAVTLPLALPIVLAFGSPELFMLGALGLSMVGSLSGGSIVKGLTVAFLGLMLAMIGFAETMSIPRYSFGTDYLMEGLPLIPIVLGLFAIPEVMELATRDVNIARIEAGEAEGGGIRQGIRDALANWWLVVRCAAIGTYIGMLPGLGAAIVDWLTYGHAVQSAKDKSRFGQGDIRGVIAPESANNATAGGSLVPTLAFGIPGSLPMAILLGALLIQGLTPGRAMLTTNLHITFSMVWTIVIANLLAAGVLLVWVRQVAKVAFIRGHLIVPGVILFVFMGAWLGAAAIEDWIALIAMGVVGTVMKRGGWPRPPLVLALILGPLLENAFQLSVGSHRGFDWLQRPGVLVIGALVVITLVLAARGIIKAKRTRDGPVIGEGAERNPVMSWPFAAALFAMFVWAGRESLQWPQSVMQFPIVIAVPGAALAFVAVLADSVALRAGLTDHGGWRATLRAAAERALLARSSEFLATLIAILLLSLLVGQIPALCLFIAAYLWRWGGYGWKVAFGYAAGGGALLYGFYDRVMHVYWHPSLLFG